jgi:4-amino-4-deoxy-L-arabinose transferase-like glycosyltransferase
VAHLPAFPLLRLPPSPLALALFALAFAIPGLAGHDLWKSHDAVGLGIVYDMLKSGDFLVPRAGGWTLLSDPPLYHWVAFLFGKSFGWLLEFHSAARLASGFFVLAAFALVYRAGRNWVGGAEPRTVAVAAFLLLLGSVGLIVHAHEAVPELASLAALCGAFASLRHAALRPYAAGAGFGIGIGVALLSASWVPPLALLAAVALAHAVCPAWRTRAAVPFIGLSLLIALLLGFSWPLALGMRSPQLFAEWWTVVAEPQGTLAGNLRYFLGAGSWFGWPAWPIALWTLWRLRKRLAEPQLFVPALALVLMLAGLVRWGPGQSIALIPLLAPLALLAAQGVIGLRRGATAALDWFGLMLFAFFTSIVWVAYAGLITGLPPRVANNLARQAPGFMAQFNLVYFAIAVLLLMAWLTLMFRTPPSPLRCLARWASGLVLLWGTFAMLLMPWADFRAGYRSVALQLRSKIPVSAKCVAQRGLGMPQAAALDYHADIRPHAFNVVKPDACPLLLVQGSPQHEFDGPGPGWTKLADVGRPGDKSERYRLYRLGK